METPRIVIDIDMKHALTLDPKEGIRMFKRTFKLVQTTPRYIHKVDNRKREKSTKGSDNDRR